MAIMALFTRSIQHAAKQPEESNPLGTQEPPQEPKNLTDPRVDKQVMGRVGLGSFWKLTISRAFSRCHPSSHASGNVGRRKQPNINSQIFKLSLSDDVDDLKSLFILWVGDSSPVLIPCDQHSATCRVIIEWERGAHCSPVLFWEVLGYQCWGYSR